MALTIKEQLEIMQGEHRPPSNLLIDVIHQIAVRHAQFFYQNYSDTTDDALATSYLNKILRLCDLAIKNNSVALKSLMRISVVILGNTITINQVNSATDDQWETVLSNNITIVFELVAGIKQDEKTAYNAIK